jgi:mannose-6-phosphate isomerase-like protein (cupin superfamily)
MKYERKVKMYNYNRRQQPDPYFMAPQWQNDCNQYPNPYPYFFSPNFRPDYFEQMNNQYNPYYSIGNMPPDQRYDYMPPDQRYENMLPDQRMDYWQNENNDYMEEMRDHGQEPYVTNIDEITKRNNNFRSTVWTGDHLQLTLMSIPVGGDIGVEMHPNVDQFIRIEEGQGIIMMGDSRDNLSYRENVYDDFAFIIPSGKYHNLVNTDNIPLKLYSIYAPPQHPHGATHRTKEEAHAAE